jgi:hypothetical protein
MFVISAKNHLEQAWYLGQNLPQEEIKLKSASILARYPIEIGKKVNICSVV